MKFSVEFLKSIPCEKTCINSLHGKKGRVEYHLTESVLKVAVSKLLKVAFQGCL